MNLQIITYDMVLWKNLHYH